MNKLVFVLLFLLAFTTFSFYFVAMRLQTTTITEQNKPSTPASPTMELNKESMQSFGFEPCFGSYSLSTSTLDTSNWQTYLSPFRDLRFRYPKTIMISEEKNDSADEKQTFLLTSSSYDNKAHLTVYDFPKSQFSTGGKITPPTIFYEPLANKWFGVVPFGSSFQQAVKECQPNPSGTTKKDGLPIYFAGEGDAGYAWGSYIVIARDSYTLSHTGAPYPSPILLEFGISDNGDSDSEKFTAEIEELIKTLEFPIVDDRT